jgi:drug/metabolite transporter (DMT)-like permease
MSFADRGSLAAARLGPRLTGIVALCAGAFVFSLQDLIIKWVSGDYPLPEVLAIRGVVAFFPLLLLAHLEGGLAGLRTRRPLVLLARAGLLLVSYTAYYLAIAAIPLAEAVSLYYSAPLFIVALAGPLLHERIPHSRWLVIALGLAGVVLVLRPGSGAFDPAALLSVVSAAFYGLAALMARRLRATERASVMSFYQNLVFFAAALAMGVVAGDGRFSGSGHASVQFLLRGWAMPPLGDFLLFAATGLIGAFGSWLLTQGYRMAEANVVAPFEYTSIVWAVLWGALIWGEMPSAFTAGGVALVIGAGLYVLRAGGAAASAASARQRQR